MGNEDKIKKTIIAQAGSRFLPDEIQDVEAEAELYSLEDEFEKTKKNKSYKLYLFVVLFIAVIVGGVFAFTKYLEMRDMDVEIDISEFDDLRIKEIIDSARKRGGNIDVMRIKLQVLEIEMLNKVLKVKSDYHKRKMDIISRNLSPGETDRMILQLNSAEARRIKAVRLKYRRKIRVRRIEIAGLIRARHQDEKKLKDEGGESTVSNSDRLYALKMKKLKEEQKTGTETVREYFDKYIKFLNVKYNPDFKSRTVNDVMNKKKNFLLTGNNLQKDYDDFLFNEAEYSREEFDELKNKIDNYKLVMNRLQRTPYRNSVPAAFKSIDNISGNIVKDYEGLRSKLVEAIKKKNGVIEEKERIIKAKERTIKNYRQSFNYQLEGKREDGIIVDARDKANIVVHMHGTLKIASDETASVYRGEHQVAKVILFKDADGLIKAKQVSSTSNKYKIEPTNRIILDKKRKR